MKEFFSGWTAADYFRFIAGVLLLFIAYAGAVILILIFPEVLNYE